MTIWSAHAELDVDVRILDVLKRWHDEHHDGHTVFRFCREQPCLDIRREVEADA